MATKSKKSTGKKKTTKKGKPGGKTETAVDKTEAVAHETEKPVAGEDAVSPDAPAEPTPEIVSQVAEPEPNKPETPEPTPEPTSQPPTVPTSRLRDPRLPAVGTTITRIFKGRKLEVLVTETGFEYEGKTYSSISALAKFVTGHKAVNGYSFFRLGTSAGGKGSTRHLARLSGKIRKLDGLVVKMRAAVSEAALALADADVQLEEMRKKATELQQGQ